MAGEQPLYVIPRPVIMYAALLHVLRISGMRVLRTSALEPIGA